MQLRWDWADIGSFYNYSGDHLSHLSVKLDDILSRYRCGDVDAVCDNMDNLYQDIVNILVAGANLLSLYVANVSSNFGGMRN